MRYYPAFLALRDRRCVVIGGGPVAEGKVEQLLDAEASVTVVAPALTPRLAQLADQARITHVARAYRRGDLEGAFLAIGGTDDRHVNHEIWEEAGGAGVLLNLVDDAPRCGFIAPSVVRRGDLTVAISTGGRAPALAVRLRERLERELGPEHGRFLELAGTLRERLAARTPEFERRRELWYRLVDSDVLELLRRGEEDAAGARMLEITGVAPVAEPGPRGAGQGTAGTGRPAGPGGTE